MGTQTRAGTNPVVFYIALLLLFSASVAVAETEKGWDRFVLTAGAYDPDIDSSIRLDSSLIDLGTPLDLESDLSLEDSDTVPYVTALWRITNRFGLEASYFELERSASSTLGIDVTFGDETYLLSTDVASEFDTTFAELSLRFSFIMTEKFDVSASLGAYYLSLDASIEEQTGGNREAEEAEAPLPVVGASFKYKVIPSLTLSVGGKYFGIEIDDIDGSLVNYGAGIQWDPIKFLGIGLAYEYFELDAESENSDFLGDFNMEYKGPRAYLALRF
jgi:long-subunit fatty acid transport protein